MNKEFLKWILGVVFGFTIGFFVSAAIHPINSNCVPRGTLNPPCSPSEQSCKVCG